MKEYYLHNGEENSGPFNSKELKDLKITKDTPVWSNDMEDWKKAGEIDELKSIFSKNPPPLKKLQKNEYQKPKKSNFFKYLILAVSIIAFLAIGSNIISENTINQDNITPEEDDSVNMHIRNNITSLIQVNTNQYSVDAFGGISNLDVIVTNNTDFTIDEITVAIAYIKKNDGVFKTEYVTFNNIPPNQNKSLSAPDSNRGLSVKLTNQSIASTELNLCYNNSFTPAVGDPDPYKCN